MWQSHKSQCMTDTCHMSHGGHICHSYMSHNHVLDKNVENSETDNIV